MGSKNQRFCKRYGPWALVTGATSGIGREIAFLLGESGMNLIIVARGKERLTEVARQLEARCGCEVRPIAIDLTAGNSVAEVVKQIADLDVGLLVSNAGFGTSGDFSQSNLVEELEMLSINCATVLSMSRWFTKRLETRGYGGMIFLSSIVAFQGVPNSAHYAATKAYIQSLAEALHVELKDKGIDVLASAPGPVSTGFAARAGLKMKDAQDPKVIAKQTIAALGKRMTVRPGRLSKLLEYALKTVPRWGRVRIMGKVMGGMMDRTPVRSGESAPYDAHRKEDDTANVRSATEA